MLTSRRRLFGVFAALAAVGCLSPTLPMPPPEEPNMTAPDETGSVRLQGLVEAHAWVFAVNRETQLGYLQGTGADGRYDLEVKASSGDTFLLWYEIGEERSQAVRFTIPEPEPEP
jgi:hypothetical protein